MPSYESTRRKMPSFLANSGFWVYYTAIDELLAKQDTPERRTPKGLKREVVAQVSNMWQQALRDAGVEE
jgi:hypothetical protein